MLLHNTADFEVDKARYMDALIQIFKNGAEIKSVAQIKRLSAPKLSYYHKIMVEKIQMDETQEYVR